VSAFHRCDPDTIRVERWTSPTGRIRILTHLGTREARRFAAVTRAAAPALEQRLGPFVFANRPRPGGGTHPWTRERSGWNRAVRRAGRDARAVLVSDVQACYPSIGERALIAACQRAGGDAIALITYLERFHDLGVPGLPIGPTPSAALANAVLGIADDAAHAAGVVPIRWVDDVVFAGGEQQVVRAHAAWRLALDDLGLQENEEKVRMFRAPREALTVLGAHASIVGEGSRGIIRTS
jgi:hypothetical protein